ncbi:hypothetical protein CLV24_11089 [Pontibacter ummariensis]|uniref:DUF6377 domain-containing protein n=1 Tax=Pontibacter ummariensis TaxID=1610492 RepID=A0A239G4G4_9BACT|nr:DUF6377 domain-containing protein [Pontibacter ummariensis]PRY11643.1 hypothetical protein CLV24_11089 [Pontibacter ummariensis]SNS64000.1 hypothetical protein SAMN06296052_11059 [Pontibacter ummariensis]
MIYKGVLFVFLFLFLFCVPAAYSFSKTDSLLHELSRTIENREVYVKEKQDRIERLKNIVSKNELSLVQQFDIYNKIHSDYRAFQFDSAFTYAQKLQLTARQLQDPVKEAYARLKLSLTLLSSGMFNEALDSLNAVHPNTLPDSIKVDYHALKARAYYDLSAYTQSAYYSPRYKEAGGQHVDSALALLSQNTLRFYALRGLKRETTSEPGEAREDFQTILDRFHPSLNQYAMAAHSLGVIYSKQGDVDKAIEMLARAAIADIKASVTEGVALMTLAEYLYQHGDESRAYTYIKQALKDADFYGAKQRKIQVAAILPVIEGERLATVESQRTRLLIFAIAVSVLSLLVVVFAYIIFKQLRQLKQAKRTVTEANVRLQEVNYKLTRMNEKLQETNDELLEANRIKEEYIGYSFNMYTEYLDKIEKLKKSVDRKLMNRKFDEISHVMDSVNMKKEREALYQSFDKVFLKLFPDFVKVFNSFFKEEDKFLLKDNQSLNIELRIFALIRIGINDHEQIAKILEYSVRTIYNYKTKVKNRSIISNDEFEQKVMEIRAIEPAPVL